MQSSLIFILGFLSAGLIALIVAPVAWRRAVELTRRRIEASVPLTQAEIEADKDRMRAEFAMATRRLEINFKNFREKAAAQIVEINRNREELKTLMAERTERHEALTRLELQSGEIEKLNSEMAALRSERRDADRKNQETIAQNRGAHEALKAEQERALALEARIERLLATIADRDEKLDRREREAGRMRETVRATSDAEEGLQSQIAEVQAEKARLESENAELSEQLASYVSGAKSKEMERLIAKVSADRELLEERVKALTRENRKLKVDVAVHERTKSDEWSGEKKESARLREKMNELAAEVIRLTAALEGPDSPIEKALGPVDETHHDNGRKASSLAEKVRELQKAAATS